MTLADRDVDRLGGVVDELAARASTPPVWRRTCDEDAVAALVTESHDRWGRLDVLVNNAGVSTFGRIDEMSTTEWHRVLAVNLDSVFFASRAAIAHLRPVAAASSTPARSRASPATTASLRTAPRRAQWPTTRAPSPSITLATGCASTPSVPGRRHADARQRAPSIRLGVRASRTPRPPGPTGGGGRGDRLPRLRRRVVHHGHNVVVDGGVTAATGQPNFDRLFRAARAERDRREGQAEAPTANPS